MHKQFSFWIDGEAQPQQGDRSRVMTPKKGKPFVHHYQKKTGPKAEWVACIKHVAAENKPDEFWDGPLALAAIIVRRKPKSWPKKKMWPYKIPDLDNYEKPLLDALNGISFIDDSRIVAKHTYKAYGKSIGVLIVIIPVQHSGLFWDVAYNLVDATMRRAWKHKLELLTGEIQIAS